MRPTLKGCGACMYLGPIWFHILSQPHLGFGSRLCQWFHVAGSSRSVLVSSSGVGSAQPLGLRRHFTGSDMDADFDQLFHHRVHRDRCHCTFFL